VAGAPVVIDRQPTRVEADDVMAAALRVVEAT
jgi:hypothetical protein